MIICISCKKQMSVMKNGILIRYGIGHNYSADLLKCTNCNYEIALCSTGSFHNTEPLTNNDIQMP